MPSFDLATFERQHVINCLFSFYRKNTIQKHDFMIKIENLAQHLSHITSLAPCYIALTITSY